MTETRTLKYKSLSLKKEDLKVFENILLKDSNFGYKRITVGFGSRDFTQTIEKEGFSDIVEETILPDIIENLSIHFADIGHVTKKGLGTTNEILLGGDSSSILISVSGESGWVTIKTEQIKKFLDRRKTYNFIFHEYNLLFLSGMFVIIFYLLNNSGSISSIPELWIGVGSIVLSMFLVSKLREIVTAHLS